MLAVAFLINGTDDNFLAPKLNIPFIKSQIAFNNPATEFLSALPINETGLASLAGVSGAGGVSGTDT